MGSSYFGNAGTFLIHTLFGLVLLILMVRLLMQLVRADFRNPVSQFIVKVSNPLVIPLRRIIPGLFGIDMATVLLLLVFQCLELFLVAMVLGQTLQPAGIAVLAIAELLDLLVSVYIFGILIQIIISWVNPGVYNPVLGVLHAINEPLLRPARRIIPPISGFDLSPILVMVGLQLVSMLVVHPLSDLARTLL